MTYEEFLQLTEKNLKRFFPESFQERKVEIREVLKNNNIKLQGVYLSGSPSYTSVPLLYLESYYQELENGKKLEDVWQNIARDYQKCQETAITIDGISSKEWNYETIKKGLTVYVRNAQENVDFLADCPHEICEDLALVDVYKRQAILRTEMEDAFEMRKNLARRMGEEAGTKLLAPLFLMLGIVMVMIMAPAMMTMG